MPVTKATAPGRPRVLGDFRADRRLVLLCAMAVVVGLAATAAADAHD